MRTLLSAHELTKSYGRQNILDRLNFVVTEQSKIGLIGRNGAGKTTLLHILAGTETADNGAVSLMPITRLGVLDQYEVLPSEGTTLELLLYASGKQEWQCKKLAARFAFTTEHLAQSPTALSGGYQMRLKIVRMLLADPNLLLLDEPVNYLDLSTLLLFESFLRSYNGAYVITSHDREILMNLCTTTWEIERAKLVEFSGNVATYLDWKDEQTEYARRTNKKIKREIASNQAFADRFRYKASQASRAQSKLKHITKLRTKLLGLRQDLPTAIFRINCAPVPSGSAVHCKDISIGYNNTVVASGIHIEIPRGSKTAIVGENGRGKSTLLKTLAGALQPLGGAIKWWHRADIGYFSQLSEETLAPILTVLQALTQAAPPDASAEKILATAGAFLFRNDDLEKQCSVLSGGERARVRLARLVLAEHNVLLLDEPTNNLDAETVEVLAQALKEYIGTVIVVSHARTFMNGFVDRIYEVRNGSLRHYMGTYEEYVADLTNLIATEVDMSSEPTTDDAEKHERALRARENRRARQRIEEKLSKLETEKSAILKFYFENPTDYVPEKTSRLAELEEEIAELEKEWTAFED